MESAPAPLWKPLELAARLDHTLLAPATTPFDIDRLCDEALEHRFATVCVNGSHVERCVGRLRESGVGVCSVIAFPLGACHARAKREEARLAVEQGASELDMVLQIGALRSGRHEQVAEDIRGVVEAARGGHALVKVILETGALTRDEIVSACGLAERAGADFVKTSTGFGPRGASRADVELMRANVSARVGVKASGGIRTAEFACELLALGATRLGTSSSVAIVRSLVGS